MKLLLGTANKGKILEMSSALSSLPLSIITPLDLRITDVPVEEENTFEGNARQKARFYFERSNVPTLADDSGIMIEALEGELGIHTRRWGAGKDATDEEWISFFLERMSREENKRARFMCVLCYIDENGTEHFFEGSCNGTITHAVMAPYLPGLPLSSCFIPSGLTNVYTALSLEEKNAISHRGKALHAFEKFMHGGQEK